MKLSFFDTHNFEKTFFDNTNQKYQLDINYLNVRLSKDTAILAKGSDAICAFVNDKIDGSCIKELAKNGVKIIALRSAGFNHVNLKAAKAEGLKVVRVPAYSPYAVAEYTIALLLCLNRKIHKAYNRVREHNFSLDGLVGFDLHNKSVGIIGTGKIGALVAKSLSAFGAKVLCYDLEKAKELESLENIEYVDLEGIWKESDIVSLHVPLNEKTKYLINKDTLAKTKKGLYIINTGRGALIDSKALINALKSQHIGGAALDVYEEEEEVFFQNVSEEVLQDDVLARLMTFPNVIITSHQAFLTKEALENIASTTLESVFSYLKVGRIPEEREVLI